MLTFAPQEMPARALRLVWFALLMSVVIYGFTIFMVVPEIPSTPFAPAFSNQIVVVLHAVGLMVFVMAFVVSSRLAPARLALIVRWALLEASAVFGLLAAFLARDPRLFAPLGFLAVVGMLASYPTDERLLDVR